MRAAVGKAISTTRTSRLPRLLFAGSHAHDKPASATPASPQAQPRDTRFLWLFVPSPHGYSVAAHGSDETPRRGALLELNGVHYRVAVVAPSPFLDGHRCVYLEPPAPGD